MKMPLAYVTSDHHFGHDKMANLRGYANAQSFAEAYVQAHNSVVQEHNAVVFLGDVCMSPGSLNIIKELRGTKHLVLGNHDQFTQAQYLEAGFKSVNAMLFSGSAKVVLTHYPVHPCYFSFRQADWVNIHGHTHLEWLKPPYINACIEHSLKPRLIGDLIKCSI
jgi:calcineurin-like phosphoesterase family protein